MLAPKEKRQYGELVDQVRVRLVVNTIDWFNQSCSDHRVIPRGEGRSVLSCVAQFEVLSRRHFFATSGWPLNE